MIAAVGLVVAIAGIVALAIVIFLAAETAASFFYQAPDAPAAGPRGRIAVVIPAHNEEGDVGAAVAAARSGLGAGDRVLVVADNCSDATATVARAAGAEVVERRDKDNIGKAHVLQFGVDHLRADPPATVVFLDADCTPAPGAVDRIARLSAERSRPVQALYIAHPAPGAGPSSAVSAFGWLVINRVRMAGLQVLGGFSRLTGSGMAFPWSMIAERRLASGEIVEDLALTLSLVEAGAPPLLDTGALVESTLAASARGAATQRARWEIGSIRMARRRAGALFARGLAGDRRALLMALDISIPPLTVLTALLAAGAAISLLLAFAGHRVGLVAFAAAAMIFGVVLIVAWRSYGRKTLPPETLSGLWSFLVGKLHVYGEKGRRSAESWTPTDRSDGA